MKRILKIKIDVTKIDKARLFKGSKGTYLDATIFLDDDGDQYDNNGMISQDVTKEERESGVKGAILGNAKIIKVIGNQAAPSKPNPMDNNLDEMDEIPF